MKPESVFSRNFFWVNNRDIYHLTESLPTVGERVTYKGLECTVHSVQNNRIKKVRVKIVDDKKETSEKNS